MENIPVKQFVNTCKVCGNKFKTDYENEKLCLPHKIISDCKLPEDTIVNMNLVLLWKGGSWDRVNGMEKILCEIAEGVVKLDGKEYSDRNIYSTLHIIKSDVRVDSIERLIIKAKKQYYKKLDVIVVLRFKPNGNYFVYGLDYSQRLYNILSKKDSLYKKKYAINLISRYIDKELKK